MKIVSSLAPLLLVTLLVPAARAAPLAAEEGEPAPERPEIVRKAIEHHGGDLYEASDSAFEIASRSGTFRVEVRRDGGLYEQVVEAETREGLRRVVVTNDDVTVTVDGEEQAIPADRVQRWRDHVAARVWFPYLPYGLDSDGVYTHDLGLEEWPASIRSGEGQGRSRELHKVKVTFQPGSSTDADDEYMVWFDPETGRLEQLAYSFDGGLRFRTAENYRRVGGILFADHQNYGIDFEEGARDTPGVDDITPELVADEMEHISTIELREIEVEGIE